MPKTSPSVRIPSYRKHSSTGQAVVTIGDKDIYLGKHNSAASRLEYNRLIAEYTAAGGNLPSTKRSDYTIAELLVAYLKHATEYYRHADGTPTSEIHSLRLAMRPLKELYGRTSAADFGPLAKSTSR